MLYGVISDVHGNLEALEEVLTALRQEKVDKVLCLGDLVGYGANPNEVVALAREGVDVCVAGNHDYGAVAKTDLATFSWTARAACQWTAQTLTEDHRKYLLELSLVHIREPFTLVHASPKNPCLWNYITTYEEVEENMRAVTTPICFVGHSHAAFLVEENEEGRLIAHKENACEMRPGARYLINPGSVGQPRDGCPHAAFAIVDSATMQVEIRRVPYDVKRAQAKILSAGLPPSLAERLAYGH